MNNGCCILFPITSNLGFLDSIKLIGKEFYLPFFHYSGNKIVLLTSKTKQSVFSGKRNVLSKWPRAMKFSFFSKIPRKTFTAILKISILSITFNRIINSIGIFMGVLFYFRIIDIISKMIWSNNLFSFFCFKEMQSNKNSSNKYYKNSNSVY